MICLKVVEEKAKEAEFFEETKEKLRKEVWPTQSNSTPLNPDVNIDVFI